MISRKFNLFQTPAKVFWDTLLCIISNPTPIQFQDLRCFQAEWKIPGGVLISAQTGCDSLLKGVSRAISGKFKFTPQLNIKRGSWIGQLMKENKSFILIYPSQRQNLLPTLEIITHSFQNFQNFQTFGKNSKI